MNDTMASIGHSWILTSHHVPAASTHRYENNGTGLRVSDAIRYGVA